MILVMRLSGLEVRGSSACLVHLGRCLGLGPRVHLEGEEPAADGVHAVRTGMRALLEGYEMG